MKIENIKFKAKRLDGKGWVEGNLLRSTAGIKERAYIVDSFSSMSNYSVISVDPSTVCQFTGLKDSNGVDLYLGDIVEFKISITSKVKKGVIIWADNLSALVLKDVLDDDWTYFYKGYITQVIDNIFDKEK